MKVTLDLTRKEISVLVMALNYVQNVTILNYVQQSSAVHELGLKFWRDETKEELKALQKAKDALNKALKECGA